MKKTKPWINKFHDAKIIIEDVHGVKKEYGIHRIIFASEFEFFEKLFDHELNQTVHSLLVPFDIEIFTIFYNKIYGIKSQVQKDLNYYENILYMIFYLQHRTPNAYINKFIKYIETNYDKNRIDTSSFIDNLRKLDWIESSKKSLLIDRISYDTFFENYYDASANRLVLTNHLYYNCFPDTEIEVNGIKFSSYSTDRYEIQQLGFWINYETDKSKTDSKPMKGKGEVLIYSGIDVYKHKIKNYKSFRDGDMLTFDSKGRHGYIKEDVNSIYDREPIDTFITFYKIIIDFES